MVKSANGKMSQKNTILFLGDVVPFKSFRFKNRIPVIINLECPISKEGKPLEGKIILRTKNNYLKDIFKSNLVYASLGNNHILDYGITGLQSTLTELKNTGVKWFGLNEGQIDNCSPVFFKFNDIDLALFSVVSNTTSPVYQIENNVYLSALNTNNLSKRIREVRSQVKRIIIYIHWGEEESSYPTEEEVLTARNLIDSGADIVIGSHAHAPQPVEKYKHGIIAYNLGNFIMPEFKKIPTYFNEEGIAQSTYSKKLLLWNRISWGIKVDLESLEYSINKYFVLFNRILKVPFTPLDKYLKLKLNSLENNYQSRLEKHLRKRDFYRKVIGFLYFPHVPEKIKKYL
jgi:Bacterial capsule synthesis protein PGA_cap